MQPLPVFLQFLFDLERFLVIRIARLQFAVVRQIGQALAALDYVAGQFYQILDDRPHQRQHRVGLLHREEPLRCRFRIAGSWLLVAHGWAFLFTFFQRNAARWLTHRPGWGAQTCEACPSGGALGLRLRLQPQAPESLILITGYLLLVRTAMHYFGQSSWIRPRPSGSARCSYPARHRPAAARNRRSSHLDYSSLNRASLPCKCNRPGKARRTKRKTCTWSSFRS